MPKAKKAPAQKTAEVEEIVVPSKIKKGLDIEVGEVFAAAPDKEDDAEVLPVEAVDGDELEDEAEIDTEEINPFGDKWEE
jgi:hypothetical protein